MTDPVFKTVTVFRDGSLNVRANKNPSAWSYLSAVLLEAHVAAKGRCVSARYEGHALAPAEAVKIISDHGYDWFTTE